MRDQAGGEESPDKSICARKLLIYRGDTSDGCGRNASLNITCLLLFFFVADLMLAVEYNKLFGAVYSVV